MDIIKQRPLRRRQNKKTSDNHPRMLVSLTYTHAQDSLGNVITRTTIVILQHRYIKILIFLYTGIKLGLQLHVQARVVGQEWEGGSFARNVDQIRHEFQLYDVTDTLRRRFHYNVGLSGLCFDFFFELWDIF